MVRQVVIITVFISIVGISMSAGDGQRILVGEFSKNTMEGWVPKKFVSETLYTLESVEGQRVLRAVSSKSASGLIKEIKVDIRKFPILNWRWRIENKLDGDFDEKQKSGDDYAARIYVVVSGGIMVWNTRAVNYVWAKTSSKEEVWPNAYAKNNKMIAIRSFEDTEKVWHTEKRNIAEAFKEHFDKEIQYIDAVVLMSDTDNTKNNVTAYYGDIFFSAQ